MEEEVTLVDPVTGLVVVLVGRVMEQEEIILPTTATFPVTPELKVEEDPQMEEKAVFDGMTVMMKEVMVVLVVAAVVAQIIWVLVVAVDILVVAVVTRVVGTIEVVAVVLIQVLQHP